MYLQDENLVWVGQGADRITLLPKMANRHGLIAGATGTGKTVTLRRMAEAFSNQGVPVFLADVKGDLSGIVNAGALVPYDSIDPELRDRIEDVVPNRRPDAADDIPAAVRREGRQRKVQWRLSRNDTRAAPPSAKAFATTGQSASQNWWTQSRSSDRP